MLTLEELYKNPVFSKAMSALSDDQRRQTEEELKRLLESFRVNIFNPLQVSKPVETPKTLKV